VIREHASGLGRGSGLLFRFGMGRLLLLLKKWLGLLARVFFSASVSNYRLLRLGLGLKGWDFYVYRYSYRYYICTSIHNIEGVGRR
jgi:hypothetical protein